ncbi:MAG: PEP-CTERM sorting domain-containing protein [Phycisphaeraceae bacterium]|nr:PEP-CTERM sorting domain-containing protein [Phycisphaeraceae bacterium]
MWITMLAVAFMAGSAMGSVLVNGDFEDTTGWGAIGSTDNPAGWPSTSGTRFNPASQQTGSDAIGGAGTSAFMSDVPTNCDMHQSFTETGPQWSVAFDFAAGDAGSATQRSLSGAIKVGASQIIYRVNGEGDFQVFDKAANTWGTPIGLAASVVMDSDVSVSQLVHHIVFSADTSVSVSYDITITDSNSTVFSATGITAWGVSTLPGLGDGVADVSFITTSATAPFVLDNVEVIVPEPTSASLLALSAVLMLWRRR